MASGSDVFGRELWNPVALAEGEEVEVALRAPGATFEAARDERRVAFGAVLGGMIGQNDTLAAVAEVGARIPGGLAGRECVIFLGHVVSFLVTFERITVVHRQ